MPSITPIRTKSIVGEPEVVEDASVAEKSVAWLDLKAAAIALAEYQVKDGSIPDAANRPPVCRRGAASTCQTVPMTVPFATSARSSVGLEWELMLADGKSGDLVPRGPELIAAVGFSIGSKGYVAFGNKSATGVTNELWEYDPATGEWTQKSTCPGTPRLWPLAFVIGDKAYAGAGIDNLLAAHYLNDFWQYDPAVDAWTEVTALPAAGRYQAVAFSIGNHGYIGTGVTSFNNYLSDFWQYTHGCESPEVLTTTNIKSNSAKVNWNIVPDAETYNVRYRKTGTSTWTKTTSQLNYKKLVGLAPNTQYDWSVKSVCDAVNNVSSDWSAIQNFTTKPLKLEGENDDEEISVSIFPNPTSTTITLSLPSNQNAILSIFNLLGEKVKEEKVTGREVTMDVSSLPQGLYLVRMENGVVGKFVKE